MTILPLKNTPHVTTQIALPLRPKPDQHVESFPTSHGAGSTGATHLGMGFRGV